MTFNDMQYAVSNLAHEKKDLSNITSIHRHAWDALTQEQRTELVKTYHEATKYYQEWDAEDNTSTIGNINCLI